MRKFLLFCGGRLKYRVICSLALAALIAAGTIIDHAYWQHVHTLQQGDDVGLALARSGLTQGGSP